MRLKALLLLSLWSLFFPVNGYARPLDATSVTQSFRDLLSTIKIEQADWITRLDVICDKINTEYFRLSLSGAVDLAWTAWSDESSTGRFATTLSNDQDRTVADIDITIATQTLPMLRHLGTTKAKTCQSPARCAAIARLANVRTVADVAKVFTDSIADLASELSDYERALFNREKIRPSLSGDVFTIEMGALKVTLDARSIRVKGKLSMAQNDKLPTLVWTYLTALTEAKPAEMALLKKSLATYVRGLR